MTGPARGNRIPAAVRAGLQVILCDADGNLFPSEEPAFAASAGVTNRMLAAVGGSGDFTGEELRQATTGLNFRTTAHNLINRLGLPMPDLERWVEEEKRVVTAHLSRTLHPDPQVLGPLTTLAGRYRLAAVSSSVLSRLDACFRATGLDTLIGPAVRFSAEDSLPAPASKPDPAVYRHACEQLGIPPTAGLAVEDSVAGVRSAVAAGCPTVGNVTFVPAAERFQRAAELRRAGVLAIVPSWSRLAELLVPAAVVAGEPR